VADLHKVLDIPEAKARQFGFTWDCECLPD
jgi:hypothetical protein